MNTILITFSRRTNRRVAMGARQLLGRLGTVGEMSPHRPWSYTFTWDLAKYSVGLPVWFILMWNVKVEDVNP